MKIQSAIIETYQSTFRGSVAAVRMHMLRAVATKTLQHTTTLLLGEKRTHHSGSLLIGAIPLTAYGSYENAGTEVSLKRIVRCFVVYLARSTNVNGQ